MTIKELRLAITAAGSNPVEGVVQPRRNTMSVNWKNQHGYYVSYETGDSIL